MREGFLADSLNSGEYEWAVVLDGVEDEELANGGTDGHSDDVRHDRWIVTEVVYDLDDLEGDQEAECWSDKGMVTDVGGR